ncbi:N-(5'-phosphoribosyl)anthranilate isomerase [Alkalihalobacillus alcalophilus ATCC 27647 = CGMCC 1.3604]|uniref:N-(5'-phosphoribosyl)anthranilate isomerase n=1 Tax=Alkalihalobacillus alcalophilus ATCC 27647 = CGMCC 1.3604 TaxID=1218173 RepID=A0A094YZZ1_ALKAL|nr:phosphoribosylanthranilate isomerase [Alkalihalobacillus alcalophilus]KGA99137.1 N-(5'-phosphoribosyl)anthranilate isomerase [Alkalihalobacillus alcalophilus ATCC 27647 = CGMCC 1.3604]MED1560484.1 phosphoribosylanthranilate isomerase [Alkalihalobacillus alcalophilus]THG92023.1 N-(5'-phosphoribosyl)anthranilate isomerase [Alkalihalobacillus alcalophilus ATCC 27647 = CGMCC 1.3604]
MKPTLKLCGNHSQKDVFVTLKSKADYIGFVFAKSKRQVTINQVSEWLNTYQDLLTRKKIVALFVNETIEMILETIERLPIDVIQCHGNESVKDIARLKEKVDIPIWKVIHSGEGALAYMAAFSGLVDGFIIDCKFQGAWGGTGHSFDWSEIPAYQKEAKKQRVPLVIAGGINPNNIDELLRFQPDGIDVSSGIEENGEKSKRLVEQLVERMNQNAHNISR